MKLDTKNKIKKNIFFQGKKLQNKFNFFFLEKWKKVKKIIRGNTLFFLPKTQYWENWKIEIFGYFCVFYVYTQNFCETNLWGYVVFQIFFWFLDTFGVSKKFAKIFFPGKRAILQKFREKKKNQRIKISGRSAEIGQIFLGDTNVGIRQIFCINI